MSLCFTSFCWAELMSPGCFWLASVIVFVCRKPQQICGPGTPCKTHPSHFSTEKARKAVRSSNKWAKNYLASVVFPNCMCSACLVLIVCVCVLPVVDLFGVAAAVYLGYLVMLGVCWEDQWQGNPVAVRPADTLPVQSVEPRDTSIEKLLWRMSDPKRNSRRPVRKGQIGQCVYWGNLIS